MNKWIKCIGKYRKNTILAPVFMALEVAMDAIIPLLMASMIDDGISAGNMNAVTRTGSILVLICALSLFGGVASGWNSARASAGFAKNLREKMFYKIQEFTFTSVDKFSNSGLVTRLTTDVTNMQNAFQMILRICARAPLMIIFSIIMVFRVNARLAWIYLAIIPILSIGLGLIIKKATPFFTKVFKLYDRLNTVVQENIRGIRVVKSFVREDQEDKKFKKASGDIHDNFVSAERIIAFNSPLMQFSMYACTILVCWLGAQMIISNTFTTGQLMSLLTYAIQILMNLMMLSMIFVMVSMSKASAVRISEVLDEESDMKMSDHPVMSLQDGSIGFHDVSFSYRGEGGRICLTGINLSIQSGQTVGIVGGTGSGKSTLTQLIPRLYDVTRGSVTVGGVDVKDYDLEVLRNQVAMVLQKNELFSGTVRDNIRWGKEDAADEEIEYFCKLAQADEFVSAFPEGYDTWIEQGGSNVSGGQKQRLCIARALIKKPKILILDDSTSAVDTKTDALIRKAFKEEIPDTTKLIIAQRISSIQEADQIIVMDGGSISAVGSHEELLKSSSIYREMYESQQKGGITDAA